MKYPHAPITEAVMDIRIQPRDDLEVEDLRALSRGAGEEFAEVSDQYQITAEVEGSPATQTTSARKVGFQFRNQAGDKTVTAQINGWGFSKLAPYDSWDAFQKQGRELWTKYRDCVQPKQILRAGVRYINRLDLPLPLEDFKQYLRTVPEVSPKLPQGLSNFFLQVQIPQGDLEALLVTNVALVPSRNADVASVILDLDLFRTANLPQTEEQLWMYFEELRKRKNEAFEACITDAMRERFY